MGDLTPVHYRFRQSLTLIYLKNLASERSQLSQSKLGCQVSPTSNVTASLLAHSPALTGSEAVIQCGLFFELIFKEKAKVMGKGGSFTWESPSEK